MSTHRNASTLKYFFILFIIAFSFACKDDDGVIGDPVASGNYFIDNQSSIAINCQILNSNRNVYIETNERVEIAEESCFCGALRTPASIVVGDLIFYRDSMGIDIEALSLIPSSNFDTSWSFDYSKDLSKAEITLVVTDEMLK